MHTLQVRHLLFCINHISKLSKGALVDRLRPLCGTMQLSYDPLPRSSAPSSTPASGEGVSRSLEAAPHSTDTDKNSMIWIGEESPTLTKLIMISYGQNVCSEAQYFSVTKHTALDHFIFPEDRRDSSSNALNEPLVNASICSCTEGP